MDRKTLITALKNYKTAYHEEAVFIAQFQELLKQPRAYFRDHLPGHMTGSAWIVDESREYVLLTHHAKLNRWLQPGGHADGEEDIERVALTEAEEETGLKNFKNLSSSLFDIDIHIIPERKEFPQHLHYDIRILLEADKEKIVSVSEESHDVKWIHRDQIAEVSGNNLSMIRMAKKLATMKTIKA